MGYYDYTQPSRSSVSFDGAAAIWIIVSLVLAIVGAFLVYFLFVKQDKKYGNSFVNYLKRFLDFSEMLIEPIIKISYIFTALFTTLASFAVISDSFIAFLLTLIFGNLILRVIYELSMIMISIWKNTRDINKKMK